MGSRPSALPRKRRVKQDEETTRKGSDGPEKGAASSLSKLCVNFALESTVLPKNFLELAMGFAVNSSFLLATRFIFATPAWLIRHIEVPSWTFYVKR